MLGFVYRTNHNPVSDDIGNNSTELSAAALSAEPSNAVCSNLSTLTQTSAKTNNPECTPVWVWPVGMTGTWHRYCNKEGRSPPRPPFLTILPVGRKRADCYRMLQRERLQKLCHCCNLFCPEVVKKYLKQLFFFFLMIH